VTPRVCYSRPPTETRLPTPLSKLMVTLQGEIKRTSSLAGCLPRAPPRGRASDLRCGSRTAKAVRARGADVPPDAPTARRASNGSNGGRRRPLRLRSAAATPPRLLLRGTRRRSGQSVPVPALIPCRPARRCRKLS
jgi:hypothetical protein